MTPDPRFMNLDDVLWLHRQEVCRTQHEVGLRDQGLLESAIAAAQNVYYYGPPCDLYDLAAAYAFHIAQNQPFIDGNKRAAFLCAMVFLEVNGAPISSPSPRLYDAMIAIAERTLDREGLAQVFRSLGEAEKS